MKYFLMLLVTLSQLKDVELMAVPIEEITMECTEKFFNKTLAKGTDALSKRGCSSKSGTNINYKLSLNLFEMGVASTCQSHVPSYEGVRDAELAFNLSGSSSSKMNENILKCRALSQRQIEESMGNLSECTNSGFANELIQAGKDCGDAMSLVMNSEDYKNNYEKWCALKKPPKKCKTLANEAYINFLKRIAIK